MRSEKLFKLMNETKWNELLNNKSITLFFLEIYLMTQFTLIYLPLYEINVSFIPQSNYCEKCKN